MKSCSGFDNFFTMTSRYETHEKLQSFMVPIHVAQGGWHEEQVDELFASLFGKGEGDGEGDGGDDGVLGNGVRVDAEFRVFG
jgi:protein AATF/BFR2